MIRYITKHKGDPERVIRFITHYCKVWDAVNNKNVRAFFKDADLTNYEYIYVFDYSLRAGAAMSMFPDDVYIPFEEEIEGRRLL